MFLFFSKYFPFCIIRSPNFYPLPLSFLTRVPGSCFVHHSFHSSAVCRVRVCPPLLSLLTRVPGSCFVHHSFHSSPVCRVRVLSTTPFIPHPCAGFVSSEGRRSTESVNSEILLPGFPELPDFDEDAPKLECSVPSSPVCSTNTMDELERRFKELLEL